MSDYTTKPQSSREYGAGTNTEMEGPVNQRHPGWARHQKEFSSRNSGR